MKPAEPFGCEVSYVDERAVLAVTGEIDLATSPRFLSDGLASLEHPISGLALDLGDASFIDSSGLGVVLTLERGARERGITFKVTAMSPAVRRAFEITGLAPTLGLSD
jgi:anti-anti-sigma factor